MNPIVQCPVCREITDPTETGYECANKHTFDAARQGYVNFLLVQKKNSREPGDNRDMIQSRRRFLDRGPYSKLSDVMKSLPVFSAERSREGHATFSMQAAGKDTTSND